MPPIGKLFWILFIRPPGTVVPEGLLFYCLLFIFYFFRHEISDMAPSADRRETLPHDRNLGALYNACPKIRGSPVP